MVQLSQPYVTTGKTTALTIWTFVGKVMSLLLNIKNVYCFDYVLTGFPHGSVAKNLPAMQETWVRSLGQEDPLEKGKATYSSILAWRIPRTV